MPLFQIDLFPTLSTVLFDLSLNNKNNKNNTLHHRQRFLAVKAEDALVLPPAAVFLPIRGVYDL